MEGLKTDKHEAEHTKNTLMIFLGTVFICGHYPPPELFGQEKSAIDCAF
jgi:hypothetical protein